jgi:protein-disulfide isomerase
VIRLAIVVAALIALPVGSAAAAPKAANRSVPARDWSRTVVATPEGGFRMGNAAAPVKLVEYGSLACPHCRHFEQTGYKPLVQNYVRTGKVSYEFRNFLLNAPDVSISLLAHCAGASKFFPMSEAVFDTQPQWEDKIEQMSADDKAAIDKMPVPQRLVRFAEIGQFPQLAARFGVAPARARQCLTDQKGLDRLLDVTKAAQAAGVHRTPTFLVNGKQIDGSTWEELEPELKKALGG